MRVTRNIAFTYTRNWPLSLI